MWSADGANLKITVPVSFDEAVLGGKIRVPTIDGAVNVSISPHTNSGKTLRLKGKGFHRKDGTRGDQLVTLMVDLPAEDEELARFLNRWGGKGKSNPRAGLGV